MLDFLEKKLKNYIHDDSNSYHYNPKLEFDMKLEKLGIQKHGKGKRKKKYKKRKKG